MARPTPPPRELAVVPLTRLLDDITFRLRQPGDVSSLARSIAQAGQLFPIEVRTVGEQLQPLTGFRRLAALRLLHRDRVLVRIHGAITDEAAALIAAADALDNRPLEREELLEMRERYRAMGWSTPALEELIGRAIEKAEERLEDLAAQLQGLPPPDRSVPDEDGDEEPPGDGAAAGTPEPSVAAAFREAADDRAAPTRDAGEGGPTAASSPVVAHPPAEPPGPVPLGRPVPPAVPRELTVAELAEDVARRLSVLSQDLATLAPRWAEVPPHLRAIVADQLAYYRNLEAWIRQSSGEAP